MKKLTPAHPGQILLQEFIQPLGLTQYRVAMDAGIPHPTMTQIVHGRRAISVENALRLGLYLGTTAEFWLNLQTDYDLRLARRGKLKAIAKQVKPLPRAA
ncbi:MAG TPA: HigA family addiction module antitoxin [Verrucomicrobiae bacterium]|jgi:addiction module HigA family antidote